jgi:dimethylargininase
MTDRRSTPALTTALVRPPGASFAQALSHSPAAPDVRLAQAQHAEYCQALAAAGLAVEALPPNERYPDSCFVQDTAVVVGGRAVIGRLAAASRQGEEETVADRLASLFPADRIIPPGTLEGGDVLILPDRIIVGRSGRTNAAGVSQLVAALAPLGIPVYSVPVGSSLHLLTVMTYLGQNVLLAAEDARLPAVLTDLDVVRVPPTEAYAANALAANGCVILPAGYPATAAAVRGRGFTVLPAPMSEFATADGGVTCLSVVW